MIIWVISIYFITHIFPFYIFTKVLWETYENKILYLSNFWVISSYFVTQRFLSYVFMKIFWKKGFFQCIKYFLRLWVAGNGGYPEADSKLRQNSKFNFFWILFFFWSFVVGSSLPQVALFFTTNIPLGKTIEICTNELFKKSEAIESLSKSEFKELSCLDTKDLHFSFDRTLYKEINDVAMSSLLDLILADEFLIYYRKNWLEYCLFEYALSYYRSYVDDIFVLFNSSEHQQHVFRVT